MYFHMDDDIFWINGNWKWGRKKKKSKVFFNCVSHWEETTKGKTICKYKNVTVIQLNTFRTVVRFGGVRVRCMERRRKMRWLNQRVGQDNGQKIQTHKVEPIQLTASGSLSNLRSGRADASRSHSPVIYSCLYGLPILHFRRPWRLPYLRTANYHLDLSKYWIDDIVCISSLLLLCVCQAEKTAVQFNWWFE